MSLKLNWTPAINGAHAVVMGVLVVSVRYNGLAWVINIGPSWKHHQGEMAGAQIAAEDWLREMLTAALSKLGGAA